MGVTAITSTLKPARNNIDSSVKFANNRFSPLLFTLHLIVNFMFAGILIPLFVLAFCNFYLIRALQQSRRLRRQQGQGSTDTKPVLTLTLTIIVIFYILFVVPSESLTFTKQVILTGKQYFNTFPSQST